MSGFTSQSKIQSPSHDGLVEGPTWPGLPLSPKPQLLLLSSHTQLHLHMGLLTISPASPSTCQAHCLECSLPNTSLTLPSSLPKFTLSKPYYLKMSYPHTTYFTLYSSSTFCFLSTEIIISTLYISLICLLS